MYHSVIGSTASVLKRTHVRDLVGFLNVYKEPPNYRANPTFVIQVMSRNPSDSNYPVSLMTMFDLHCSLEAFVLLFSLSVITMVPITIIPIDSLSNPILRYSTTSLLLSVLFSLQTYELQYRDSYPSGRHYSSGSETSEPQSRMRPGGLYGDRSHPDRRTSRFPDLENPWPASEASAGADVSGFRNHFAEHPSWLEVNFRGRPHHPIPEMSDYSGWGSSSSDNYPPNPQVQFP
jgi:hypothetical protein